MSTPEQRDRTWLRSATADQIVAAFRGGELDDMVAGRTRPIATEELGYMSPEQIAQAEHDPELARRIGTADQGARRAHGRLEGRTPEEIAAMLHAGDLDDLLGRG
jgi:hypothetical protein